MISLRRYLEKLYENICSVFITEPYDSFCMRRNQLVIGSVLLALILVVGLLLLKQSPRMTRNSVPANYHLSSSRTHQSPARGVSYRVARVVDGDTIDVFVRGEETERIRFIGIDTPETVDQRKPVQCYGPEASARMKALLTGKSVVLETKPDEDHDDYGRFLRYVILDGQDIGAEMLAEGYAKSLCAAFPHPKCSAYDALEKAAKSARKGRWSACR